MTAKFPLLIACAIALATAQLAHAATARVQLVVRGGADIRACDVVVSDPEHELAAVGSDGGATVVWKRRGSTLAIAFAAAADRPIADADVHAELVDGATAPSDARIERATCYDRLGREVAGATVAFP